MASRRSIQRWPRWQRAYAHGMFVLWPAEPVRRVVNEVRLRTDPVSRAVCEAHITLTQPFLRKPRAHDWARLVAIARGFEPFQCDYGPVRSFLPDPCIWLEVQPMEYILELRAALHSTGLFNLGLPHTDGFIPHMTLTEGRSGPKVNESLFQTLRSTVASGSFPCSSIAYIIPNDKFCCSVNRSMPLGPPVRP